MPGSSINPGSARARRSLPPCGGIRRGICCGAMPMSSVQPGEKDSPSTGFLNGTASKGAKEAGLQRSLERIGPVHHHPPCSDLIANQAFYAIAMLAYNLLISLKVHRTCPMRRRKLAHSNHHPPFVDTARNRQQSRTRAYGSGSAHLHSIRLAAVVALVCGPVDSQTPERSSCRGSGGLGLGSPVNPPIQTRPPGESGSRCAHAPGAAVAKN